MYQAETVDAQPAKPRFELKALVISSGFKHFYAFAEKVGIHPVTLSRIVNGHEFPSPNMQRKLASELGLTIKELRELL